MNYNINEMEVSPMEMKLPYYMMYPTPYLFDDEKREDWDYEYVRSMYPEMARRVLPYVEEECDRMEYDGSMMYDEYPDKLQLRLMCGRIYEKVMEQEKFEGYEIEEVNAAQRRDAADRRRNTGRQDRVRDLVELLLFEELLRRRGRHRRDRRRRIW